MSKFAIGWLVGMSLFFYICGWFCIFRTGTLVAMGRRNHAKSTSVVKRLRGYEYSSVVMKPSYPAYIRGGGIFIWAWALALDCLVLIHWLR